MTLNHEDMRDEEIAPALAEWKAKLGLPVTDALTRPATELLDMVLSAFPDLAQAPTEADA